MQGFFIAIVAPSIRERELCFSVQKLRISSPDRFEAMYEKISKADTSLQARPYLGRLALPVNSIEPDEIKPWGLFHARRNGYQHEGLDIGGELGEPVLAGARLAPPPTQRSRSDQAPRAIGDRAVHVDPADQGSLSDLLR